MRRIFIFSFALGDSCLILDFILNSVFAQPLLHNTYYTFLLGWIKLPCAVVGVSFYFACALYDQ